MAEKLFEPIRLAKHSGVRIPLEPHGEVTDSIEGIRSIFKRLGNPENLGVNLDTGNSWLGGTDPVEMEQYSYERKIDYSRCDMEEAKALKMMWFGWTGLLVSLASDEVWGALERAREGGQQLGEWFASIPR